MIAIFDCENENGDRLGIWLEWSEGGSFRRPSGSDSSPMKARDVEDAESQEFYVQAIAQVPEKKHEARHIFEFEEQVRSRSMAIVKQTTCSLERRMDLVEDEFIVILLQSHGAFGTYMRLDSFALIIGLHENYPTLSTVQFAYGKRGGNDTNHLLWYVRFRSIQHKLSLESSRHVRDYQRVTLCCGNVLEVALRRTKLGNQICWKAEIDIGGGVSYADGDLISRSSNDCHREMAIYLTPLDI